MSSVLTRSPFRLLCLAAVLTAAPARAEPVRAVFLGMQTVGLDEEVEVALAGALEARFERDPVYAVEVRDDAELAGRCAGDTRCFCEAARELDAARVIYCNIGRIEAIYTFELALVDTQSCSTDNAVFVTEELDPSSAGARLAGLGDKLLTPRRSVSETAAKAKRSVRRVPAVVTVVTDKQMRQFGATGLDELLRIVPGFEVVDTNWGDPVLHHGLGSTLLWMVDGVPLSNPKFNFGALGSDFRLALEHVERVEFVRGPGSVLWGQNAFLGIVNLITRKPAGQGEHARAHMRLGTLDTRELHASVGAHRRWFSYYVATTWREAAGPRTEVPDSLLADIGVAEPVWGNVGTTDNRTDAYHDLVARLRVAERLTVGLQYFANRTRFEISPFGSLLPPGEAGLWQTAELVYSAAWDDTLPWGLSYGLSASRYEHHSWEEYIVHPRHPDHLPYGVSSLQGNELAPEVNHLAEARVHHQTSGEGAGNHVLVGASVLHQAMPNQFANLTIGAEPGVRELDMAGHTFLTFAGFVQDDLTLLDGALTLSGGLRAEVLRREGASHGGGDPPMHLEPALSAQAALLGGVEALSGKLIYAEGTRPPAMNDLYSTTGVYGNAALSAERSRALSAELTARPIGALVVRGGGMMAWLTDLIRTEEITDPALREQGFVNTPVNRASTRVYGLHAEAQLSLARFEAFGTWAWKRREEEERPELSGLAALLCDTLESMRGTCAPVAENTASLGVSYRPLDDFNAFATASVVGSRRALVLRRAPVGVATETLPAYALVDVGVTVSNVFGMFDLTLKAKNPLRVEHKSPYRIDGRPSPLLEKRLVSEVLLTLGWRGALADVGSR